MSAFFCQRCDRMADADDGCAEIGPFNTLICVDCTEEVEADEIEYGAQSDGEKR